MRLAPVGTVFRKELVDVLRDRRTLIFMLVVPTIAIPVLLWATTRLMTHFVEKLAREQVSVLLLNPEAAPDIVSELRERSNPMGRARQLLEVLARHGISEKDLAKTQGKQEGFQRLLAEHGVDPEVLFTELRGASGQEEFEFSPGAIIARAFPPNFKLTTDLDPRFGDPNDPATRTMTIAEAIRTEQFAVAVEFAADTRNRLVSNDGTEIKVYYLESSDRSTTALRGIREIVQAVGKKITAERLQQNNLPPGFAEPLKLQAKPLPGPGLLAKLMSQLLPYLILIFSLLGALYPAIDLGAGEKERGTLETLLVAPVSRLAIVLGKFLVVLSAAMVSSILSTASLALSLRLGVFSEIAAQSSGQFVFRFTEALMAVLMVIPVSCIFAALLLAISIFAKSFKEGQSYTAPLQMLIILPAFASLIPGVQLDWFMASLPIVNVSLALKEIFTGNLDQHWAHVGVIFLSTSFYAGLMLWFSAWWFQREQVLFRS